MEIILPQLGLFVWSLLIFVVFFLLLRKFAWGPIISGIKEREESISTSLKQAEKARSEMSSLTAQNERLLAEARVERDAMLKEARMQGDKMIADAKAAAATAAAKETEKAKAQIEAEKQAAIAVLKNQSGLWAVEMAEKLVRKELGSKEAKDALAKQLLADLNNN